MHSFPTFVNVCLILNKKLLIKCDLELLPACCQRVHVKDSIQDQCLCFGLFKTVN